MISGLKKKVLLAVGACAGLATSACQDEDDIQVATSTTFEVTITNKSGGAVGPKQVVGETAVDSVSWETPLSRGAYAVHRKTGVLFHENAADLGIGLETLAEDGNPTTLVAALANRDTVVDAGAFVIDKQGQPSVAAPGEQFVFRITAKPGEVLSFATMFVQSNDLFIGPDANGIPLFVGTTPISGNVDHEILLWDAGTEANETLNVGENQPARGGPTSGPADTNPRLRDVSATPIYAGILDLFDVTITPVQ